MWSGYPERSARQNLSQTLSILRNAIGDREAHPPFLNVNHREIQFNTECVFWLDVAAFSTHIHAIRGYSDSGTNSANSAAVAEHCRQAAALYRGDFLADLMIADSVPFEEWALLQREKLRLQVLDVLTQLTENALQLGEMEMSLDYASRQLTLDAWRESAHRQKMRALIINGQRNAAIAHYENLRQTLAVDLGVEPEAATMELVGLLKLNTFASKSFTYNGEMFNNQELVGRAVGNYLIVENMGEDGITVTYKAYHTRLARYVTLKFIHPEQLKADALRAFEHQAKNLARLDHPNIVKIYDFSESDAGMKQPYLVMEHILRTDARKLPFGPKTTSFGTGVAHPPANRGSPRLCPRPEYPSHGASAK